MRFEEQSPKFVQFQSLIRKMLTTIKFNYQLRPMAIKVNDVITNNFLSVNSQRICAKKFVLTLVFLPGGITAELS